MINNTPREILIGSFSDDISDVVNASAEVPQATLRSRGVTAAAVASIFTGSMLPDSTDLNSVKRAGIFRFNTTVTNGPPTSSANKIGFLQVITGHRNTSSGALDTDRVRQIAYPDATSEQTPYTRVCGGGSSWSEWIPFGGSRRVKLTANTTAQSGVIYYSFGDYTLTLPNPTNLMLGNTIVLEQYAGAGIVTDGTYEITTSPDYELGSDGLPTATVIGATMYRFEVCAASDGTHEWVQDVAPNLTAAIAALNENCNRRYPGQALLTLSSSSTVAAATVAAYRDLNQYVLIRATAGALASTVNLPVPLNGEKVIIDVEAGHAVTVVCVATTETWSHNQSGITLHLEFEGYAGQWHLLVAGDITA